MNAMMAMTRPSRSRSRMMMAMRLTLRRMM
jgi:hypothetical protein